jgi:Cd2+/Zn2+-exporting ATPase
MSENDVHEDACSACSTEIHEDQPQSNRLTIAIAAISGVLLAIGLILEFELSQLFYGHLLYLVVMGVAGYGIFKNALTNLLHKRVEMNLLMSIAAVGAFLIGHAEEGASVIFLFFAAEFLEDYSVQRARNSVTSLLRLAPEEALVRRNGIEVRTHVHDISIGECVFVKPGEKVPLDGVVTAGSSGVNESPLTGESVPVSKEIGSQVYAGTMNLDGFLEVEVTKRSDETQIAKVAKLVQEAQRNKSPTEKFVNRFAGRYTPTVIVLALLTAIAPPLLFGASLTTWVYRALILLVVSCPCALAISTPVSMISSITGAARNGVLVKSASAIEAIAKLRIVAFDKTGTLTEGKLMVTDILSVNRSSKSNVLAVAASLEAKSSHPIASAIAELATEQGVELRGIRELKTIPGLGVEGTVDGEMYLVGSVNMFLDQGVPYPELTVTDLQEAGKTTILVARSNPKETIGIVALADNIRPEAVQAVRELRRLGIETVMISGDNDYTATAIAGNVGIDHFHAQLLPEDKVEEVEALTKKYGHVAMVGDGINDAPALAKANVGIAMGAIGTDVALETADVALMHDDVSKISYLVSLGRKTMRVIRENIWASILVKGGFAALAILGLVSLWMAVAIGDMGLSLAVILNAMRLALIRPRF